MMSTTEIRRRLSRSPLAIVIGSVLVLVACDKSPTAPTPTRTVDGEIPAYVPGSVSEPFVLGAGSPEHDNVGDQFVFNSGVVVELRRLHPPPGSGVKPLGCPDGCMQHRFRIIVPRPTEFQETMGYDLHVKLADDTGRPFWTYQELFVGHGQTAEFGDSYIWDFARGVPAELIISEVEGPGGIREVDRVVINTGYRLVE